MKEMLNWPGQSLLPINLGSIGSRRIIFSVHFEDILMSLLQMITICLVSKLLLAWAMQHRYSIHLLIINILLVYQLHQVLIMILFELKLPFMDSSVAARDLLHLLISAVLNASHVIVLTWEVVGSAFISIFIMFLWIFCSVAFSGCRRNWWKGTLAAWIFTWPRWTQASTFYSPVS